MSDVNVQKLNRKLDALKKQVNGFLEEAIAAKDKSTAHRYKIILLVPKLEKLKSKLVRIRGKLFAQIEALRKKRDQLKKRQQDFNTWNKQYQQLLRKYLKLKSQLAELRFTNEDDFAQCLKALRAVQRWEKKYGSKPSRSSYQKKFQAIEDQKKAIEKKMQPIINRINNLYSQIKTEKKHLARWIKMFEDNASEDSTVDFIESKKLEYLDKIRILKEQISHLQAQLQPFRSELAKLNSQQRQLKGLFELSISCSQLGRLRKILALESQIKKIHAQLNKVYSKINSYTEYAAGEKDQINHINQKILQLQRLMKSISEITATITKIKNRATPYAGLRPSHEEALKVRKQVMKIVDKIEGVMNYVAVLIDPKFWPALGWVLFSNFISGLNPLAILEALELIKLLSTATGRVKLAEMLDSQWNDFINAKPKKQILLLAAFVAGGRFHKKGTAFRTAAMNKMYNAGRAASKSRWFKRRVVKIKRIWQHWRLKSLVLDPAGLPKKAYKQLKAIAKREGLIIRVRPSNPECLKWIKKGARKKPEWMKNKSINKYDVALGASAENIGLIGYFKPIPLPYPVPKGLDYNTLVRRRMARMDEYNGIQKKLKKLEELKEKGSAAEIKKFREKNQFVSKLDKETIKVKGEALHDKSGKWFTGDHDLFHISRADGKPISNITKERIVKELSTGPFGAQHGFHMDWFPDNPGFKEAKKAIINDHAVSNGKEPLLTVFPDKRPTRFMWWVK